MNPYGYQEPVVPPRRKRSLSTSRTEQTYDDSFGFPNRMRRNFSTDHIPNQYMYSNMPKPASNYYMSQQNYRQPYSSSGNLLFGSVPGQIPRLMNPMALHVPQSKVPIRPHQDYLKYAQGANVPYNPYNSNFNPTLMARPAIEPFQYTSISTSITNAIARGRDPTQYSSKEQLYSSQTNLSDSRKDISFENYPNKCPPERPPPPNYNSRLSMENLSPGHAGMDTELNSRNQFRDRRSVSPSRLSPTEQKLYNVRRSTSPLPSALNSRSPELSLSRSGSRTSLNQGYPHRLSREPSPVMTRSPSPMRSHHFSFGTNLSTAHDYQPLTRSASTSKYISRSTILGGSRLSRDPARVSDSVSTTLVPNSISKSFSKTNGSLITNTSQVFAKDRMPNSDNSNLSPSSSANRAMDTLRVPNGVDDTSFEVHDRTVPIPRQMDPHFSESFTDHCDQYKSVTSKILSKKSNRKSDDFSDLYNEADNAACRKLSYSPEVANQPAQSYIDNFEMCDPFESNGHSIALEQSGFVQEASHFPSAMDESFAAAKPIDSLHSVQPPVRRSSSSNGLVNQQRKGSLPSDYIANSNSISLSGEWSREKVANMAHEARQRLQNPSNSTGTTLKKVGSWFTRQFVFLLIAGLNIFLAYIFYNLLAILPADR